MPLSAWNMKVGARNSSQDGRRERFLRVVSFSLLARDRGRSFLPIEIIPAGASGHSNGCGW